MNSKRHQGFTLMELLVAVAIIGILSGIAIPSYNKYMLRSHRTDAQGALTGLSNAMERYHSANNTYVGATLGSGGIFAAESPIDGNSKYYNLSIAASSVSAYTLYATPKNGQAGDGRLSLDSTGSRVWNSKDDGTGTDTTW